MALDKLMPRLEWNFLSKTGDTHTSTTIDDIADTSDIRAGMYVSGSGIAAGTTVISKGANSVLLSLATSSSLGNTALTFFERFDFLYPPSKDSEEQYKSVNIVKKSLSGEQQVQTNFVEITREVVVDFLVYTDRDILQNIFFNDFMVWGNSCRYYYDKNDSSYVTYTLADFRFSGARQVKAHPYFLYQLKFAFRRVA